MLDKKGYIESLRSLQPVVYCFGERVHDVTKHPLLEPHINALAETYEAAVKEETRELGTAISHISGSSINRFTHIHQNKEDLVKKVKLLRLLGQKTGTCFQRCVGFDALNAVYTVAFETDKILGTDYFERFKKYLTYIQNNDLVVAGAMTDPKGDRSKRPSQQEDKDQYLRIVEENNDGIIVRGAKVHQTGIVNSHEILVMPTVALKEDEKEYAVCFATPVDTEGVIHVFGRQTNDTRRLEGKKIDVGNYKYGIVGGEALTIFDDVFIPWERVFMAGEHQFSALLVYRFATYHRQNYGGCKTGVSDVVIGASTCAAQYNGVERASHIKDKIAEMVHLTETLYAASVACSWEGSSTPSGAYFPNTMLANVAKHNITRFIYEIYRLAHDIAGGYIATLPSEKDLLNPETAQYIEKYFVGIAGEETKNRIKMGRLIENMTGGTAQVEAMHGAGSPMAQRIMYLKESNLAHKIKLAKDLAGITDAKD